MTTTAATGAPAFTRIAKRTGGTRIITHLAPREGLRYARLAGRVARRVDAGLAPGVATDRCVGRPFEPVALARRRFRDVLDRLQRPGLVVAKVDVLDCFPSITPAVVERSLMELGCHPAEVLPVRRFLEELAGFGVHGLPVGPRSSGILANAVLRQVDHVLERDGVPFARWVDDLFVTTPDARRAGEIVEMIAETLAASGMRLNPSKTLIDPVPGSGRPAGALTSVSAVCPTDEAGPDERPSPTP